MNLKGRLLALAIAALLTAGMFFLLFVALGPVLGWWHGLGPGTQRLLGAGWLGLLVALAARFVWNWRRG